MLGCVASALREVPLPHLVRQVLARRVAVPRHGPDRALLGLQVDDAEVGQPVHGECGHPLHRVGDVRGAGEQAGRVKQERGALGLPDRLLVQPRALQRLTGLLADRPHQVDLGHLEARAGRRARPG